MSHTKPIDQSIYCVPMNPPQLEGVITPKSFVFLVLNTLTFGIYASSEAISKHHQIKRLLVEKTDLTGQVKKLKADWDELETDLKVLQESIGQLCGNDPTTLQKKKEREADIESLAGRKDELAHRAIQGSADVNASIGAVALDAICFFGYLFANIVTLGLYGLYQNCALKNQIITLAAENDHYYGYTDFCKKTIDDKVSFALDHSAREIEVRTVDEANILKELSESTAKMQKLNQDLEKAKQEATALAVAKAAEEAAKKQVEADLVKMHTSFVAEQQKAQQKENEKKIKDQELASLRAQLHSTSQKSVQVKTLEAEVQRLKTATTKLPDVQKVLSEIGPIPPKYHPKEGDGEMSGAMDVKKTTLASPAWVAFAQEYNQRYDGKLSAAAVVETSFEHAFDQLILEAKKGKIKLNKSENTAYTNGRFGVYRYMVLDLLKGAKVHQPSCHGFELQINAEVSMVPSQPEKILQYKKEPDGSLKPIAELHYKRRDDFTPNEETLQLRDGVDPVSAKWILSRLSEGGQRHLFNLLMSDLIENNNTELKKARAFVSNKANPEAVLVETAYDLIADMSTAIEKKFGQNVLPKCWEQKANEENVEAFVKAEDSGANDPTQVEDTDKIKTDRENFVKWELNHAILGDQRIGEYYPRQPKFIKMVIEAQKRYETGFKFLNKVMVAPEYNQKKVFHKLTLPDLNEQYYHSHEMIGSTAANNFEGGAHCLFSNLLATLFGDKQDLSMQNFYFLKNAMARYLDDPDNAKKFEGLIKNTHNQSVANYQKWLRGVWGGVDAGIDLNDLSTLEIELAAYTLGVRIAVIPLEEGSASLKIDEIGRIVPSKAEYYFGPNTKEYLTMAAGNKTYYGLFPRIDPDKVFDEKCAATGDEYLALAAIGAYWESIKPV